MTRCTVIGLSLVLTSAVFGQCTSSDLGLDPATQPVYMLDIAPAPYGMMTLMKPAPPMDLDAPYQRAVMLLKNDASGASIWKKVLMATNPTFRMRARGLLATGDGGSLTYGDIRHGSPAAYINQFAIKLDGNGDVQWARIYMFPDSGYFGGGSDPNPNIYAGNRSAERHGMRELPGSGFNWAIHGTVGVYCVHLEQDGMPSSAWLFRDPGSRGPVNQAIPLENGGLFGCHYLPNATEYYTTDQNGAVVWAETVTPPTVWVIDPFALRALEIYTEGLADVREMLLEMKDGHLVSIGKGSTGGGMVLCLSPDGGVAWAQRPSVPQWSENFSLTEIGDGQLVFGNGWNVFRRSGDGLGDMDKWNNTNPEGILEARGDSLLVINGTPGGWPTTEVKMATTMDQLSVSCGTEPAGSVPVVALAAAVAPISLVSDTVHLKSWTLSLTDPADVDLDLAALGAAPMIINGYSSHITGSVVDRSGTTSGEVTVTLTLPSIFTPSNIHPAPTSIVGDQIIWTIAQGLPAFGSWSFDLQVHMAYDPLLTGTSVTSTLQATQGAPEIDMANNTQLVQTLITSSFDPNNKLARTSSGTNDSIYFSGTDNWIDYTINFQNTGTADAVNIVVVDSLPHELRSASLSVVGASHPFTYTYGGNGVLRFTFANINLPDSTTDEPNSHGSVSFRLRPESGLAPGTLITNHADILFDFNPPVRTADNHVWIDQATSVPARNRPTAPRIFPDPVRDRMSAMLPDGFLVRTAKIVAADGRVLRSVNPTGTNTLLSIPVEDLPPQVYMLLLEGQHGERLSARFVKE